jgi:hypothetical protein
MYTLDFWMNFVALVGLAFVISVSPVSRAVADWLKGFEKVYNPLLWLGHAMGCTLHAGFWMGFWWAVADGGNPLIRGGLVAGGAFVADLLLALIDSGIRGMMSRYVPPGMAAQDILRRFAPPPPKEIVKEVQRGHRPLTEEEAHAMVDSEDDRAVA